MQQIAQHLRCSYPHDEGMQASYETIYKILLLQPRGSLRQDLTAFVRTRRTSCELCDGRSTEPVVRALSERILKLPDALRRTLSWDQGKESGVAFTG